jgi:hypothetical protein
VTCLIVDAEYNIQPILPGILGMVMACVQTILITYVMFVNSFARNTVKTAQIHLSWYEEIARIDSAQANSDPPFV